MHGIDLFWNIILISVPETFLLAFITLIFLKRDDFFYKKNMRENIIALSLFIIVPFLLFSNILFYIGLGVYLRVFLNSILMTILMYLMLGYFGTGNSLKEHFIYIGKLYMLSLLPLLMLTIIEVFEFMLLQYLFNFNISLLNTNSIINFLISIPIQVILFFIVYINYVKVNTPDSLILGIVWKEKFFFREIIYIQIILNMILSVVIYNKFVINNVLNSLEFDKQFFIVFLIFSILLIEILLPWFIILTVKLKQGKELRRNLT